MTEQQEFLELYDRFRVRDQAEWYGARSAEYRAADRQGYFLTQLLLLLSSGCGLLAALDINREVLGLVAAVLATAAAFITSWSELIGFRANAELYEAAAGGLAHVRPERFAAADSPQSALEYVNAVEGVLLGEVQTWTARWRDVLTAGGETKPTSDTASASPLESHPETP